MRLQARGTALLIIGIFWGIIGLSMATGFWQTKTSTEAAIAKTPEDIKGWMTLENVSQAFNIPEAELARICGLSPEVDFCKPLKEIAEENGKETEYYRDILRKHLGKAGEVSKAVTKPVSSPVSRPVSNPEALSPDQAESQAPPESKNASRTTEVIRGKMTLKEVETVTKVPAPYICKELGLPPDTDQNIPLRDLAQQHGFEVDAVRDIVDGYKKGN